LDALAEYVDGYLIDRYEKGTAVDLGTPKLGPADLAKSSKIANTALSGPQHPGPPNLSSPESLTSSDSILIMISVETSFRNRA